MINVKHPNGRTGLSVGQRKDGSRAVLWSDQSIQWYSAPEFQALLMLEGTR